MLLAHMTQTELPWTWIALAVGMAIGYLAAVLRSRIVRRSEDLG